MFHWIWETFLIDLIQVFTTSKRTSDQPRRLPWPCQDAGSPGKAMYCTRPMNYRIMNDGSQRYTRVETSWNQCSNDRTLYFQGTMDFTKFRTLDMKLLDRVDKMLSDDIAKLMVLESLSTQARSVHWEEHVSRRLLRGTLFNLNTSDYWEEHVSRRWCLLRSRWAENRELIRSRAAPSQG